MWRVAKAVILLSALWPSAALQAATINAGGSLVLQFENLTYAGDFEFQNQANPTVYFSGNLLDAGEAVTLALFDDAPSGSPAWSNTYTSPTDHFGACPRVRSRAGGRQQF